MLAISSRLASQTSSISPRLDSLQVWLESTPQSDSEFLVRARFLSKKSYPLYLFWRSQTKSGFEKQKASGDFVALPNDTTLVWQRLEKYRSADDARTLDFYVLDNDEIVAKATLNFNEIARFDNKKSRISIKKEEIKTDSTIVAQNNPKPKTQFLAKDDFEIDGLVTSDVRTNFGRQFLAQFSQNWQPPEKIGGWWVSIREILTPGRFTIISVSLNNRELFQRYLNPSPDYLKDLAEQTAIFLADLIKNGDPDGGLTADDLNGKLIEN